MALLIDGYNLLNVTNIFGEEGEGTELHRSRLALLTYLAGSLGKRDCGQTTIVFDAAGAPAGLPATMTHDGIRVHFARRHADADEMIEEMLDGWKAPRSLTVVSSDHRVQRAARQKGANYIDSDRWFKELQSVVRKRDAAAKEAPAKPDAQMSPEETAYWLGEFTKATDDRKRRP